MPPAITAPGMTLSYHRAVYNARCGRPQPQESVSRMRTEADKRRGRKQVLLADALY